MSSIVAISSELIIRNKNFSVPISTYHCHIFDHPYVVMVSIGFIRDLSADLLDFSESFLDKSEMLGEQSKIFSGDVELRVLVGRDKVIYLSCEEKLVLATVRTKIPDYSH